MCVIGYTGVIGYERRTGAYNSEVFIDFIRSQLQPFFSLNPNKILIMDNARFHHSRVVLEEMRRLGIPFKFLPPYSPQLNPIEEFFSMMKSRYNEIKTPNHSISDCLDVVLRRDYTDQCVGFYRNMQQWLERGRNGIAFE